MATSDISTSGITGSDGVTPLYSPNERWCIWNLDEIYVGTVGTKRYVPKINDYVVDITSGTFYKVRTIDPVTLICTYDQVNINTVDTSLSENDILFGVGPGTQSDTYLAYVDASVVPSILAVDARLRIGGSMASYCKIFKGADVSSSGKVISRVYDQNGTLLTQNIPLELAAIDSHTNHSIKIVSVAHTVETLTDGEIVTVVVYDDVGHVVSKRQLLVENTAFIRSINVSQKYISHISLASPFMSSSDNTLIELPINVLVEGLDLYGIVHYSDGTTLKLPVDGTKFRMFGLEQYLGTVVGQRVQLVLRYALSTGETAYGAVSGDGKSITKQFTLNSLVQNGAYAVKLFGYPVWVDTVTGYKMEWFLYSLDRNIVYNVTDYVRYSAVTGAFRPKAYGFSQDLTVSINLRDVSGSFKSYIHAQNYNVVLVDNGAARTTNWTVTYEPGQVPLFGVGLHAQATLVSANNYKLTVHSGLTTKADWLNRVYYASKPIIDLEREITAPEPNFFAIIAGNNRVEFSIDDWDKNLTIGSGPVINGTVFIEFFKRVSTNDIQLAIAGMPIYN
jgi:hypothetical protein